MSEGSRGAHLAAVEGDVARLKCGRVRQSERARLIAALKDELYVLRDTLVTAGEWARLTAVEAALVDLELRAD